MSILKRLVLMVLCLSLLFCVPVHAETSAPALSFAIDGAEWEGPDLFVHCTLSLEGEGEYLVGIGIPTVNGAVPQVLLGMYMESAAFFPIGGQWGNTIEGYLPVEPGCAYDPTLETTIEARAWLYQASVPVQVISRSDLNSKLEVVRLRGETGAPDFDGVLYAVTPETFDSAIAQPCVTLAEYPTVRRYISDRTEWGDYVPETMTEGDLPDAYVPDETMLETLGTAKLVSQVKADYAIPTGSEFEPPMTAPETSSYDFEGYTLDVTSFSRTKYRIKVSFVVTPDDPADVADTEDGRAPLRYEYALQDADGNPASCFSWISDDLTEDGKVVYNAELIVLTDKETPLQLVPYACQADNTRVYVPENAVSLAGK